MLPQRWREKGLEADGKGGTRHTGKADEKHGGPLMRLRKAVIQTAGLAMGAKLQKPVKEKSVATTRAASEQSGHVRGGGLLAIVPELMPQILRHPVTPPNDPRLAHN